MWKLEIEHIGGIRSGKTTLNSGPNIVQASNFQGKSSLLSAIQTVVGTTGQFGEQHPLMEGKDKGYVTLETDDKTYSVTLSQSGGVEGDKISWSGNTYLTKEQDRVAARLFAFLGEDNPVRAAVREQDEKWLTELLKKPLETENIDLRIESLRNDIVDIEEELDKSKKAAEKLPAAQEEVTQLKEELEEVRERRDDLEEKVNEDTEQRDLRNKLTSKQSDLERKQRQVERLENQIERRENQFEEKKAELEELEVPDELDLDTNISEKRERVEELELKIELLKDLYRSNKAVLDENEISLISEIEQSLSGDTFSCWVCGEDATEDDIRDRLQNIIQQQQSLKKKKSNLDADISDIQQRKEKIRTSRQKKTRLEDEIKQLKLDIQEDENDLGEIKEQIEVLKEEVEEMEAEYEEAEEEEEKHSSELKTVQRKIGTIKNRLERSKNELEQLDEEASNRDEIKEDLTAKRDELEDLKQRRGKKYEELVDQFDAAMDDIIQTFAPGFDGAYLNKRKQPDDTVTFEINLAREGRTTDLDNLSEGERALVGIVTALAGYRTFNVDERVPCILLDGIGQLAAEHIQHMIDYLKDATELLVTTAYPEAGLFDGKTISPDTWEVISDEEVAAI